MKPKKVKGTFKARGKDGKLAGDRNHKEMSLAAGKGIVDEVARYYGLPKDNLNSSIVMHKMSEVLELYLKLIQQVLQPEEFHSLHECAVFDDVEKSKMFELYSRIIMSHRELLRAMILNDEKNSIATIQYVHSEMIAVKPMMLDIVKKMQHSWTIDINKESKSKVAHYFG